MSEVRYIVHYEYPDGHEMSGDSFGPGTEAELRDKLSGGSEFYDEGWLDELFAAGIAYPGQGDSYRLETVKDWVLVVQWTEPEDGVAVYGPYESEDQAKDDWPNIEPDFYPDPDISELPESVIFSFQRMVPPYLVKP